MTGCQRIREKNHTLVYSEFTLGFMVGFAIVTIALFLFFLQSVLREPFMEEHQRAISWGISIMILAGFILLTFYKRTVIIHQYGTVSIERHFLFKPYRRDYTRDEMFGLAEYIRENTWKSDDTIEIYRIELVLTDGKRLTLIRCSNHEELGDCCRKIERFTGIQLARKKYGGLF